MEKQGTLTLKRILKKNNVGGIILSNIKNYYITTVLKAV